MTLSVDIAASILMPTFSTRQSIELVKAFGNYDSVNTYTELVAGNNSAINSIQISQAITLAANITINKPLTFTTGGSITTAGFTLTINGAFSAGKYQVFYPSATGEVVFGQRATNEILPEWFGALADDSTSCVTAFAYAVGAVPANGGLIRLGVGTYQGWVVCERGNVTIAGSGLGQTIIKIPNSSSVTVINELGNSVSGTPIGITFGQTRLGNLATAFENCHVRDLSLNGNRANQSLPPQDIFGLGLMFTKMSNSSARNVRVYDFLVEGVGNVINSNYNYIQVLTKDNGESTFGFPNFDCNSSKHCHFDIIAEGGEYGGRFLDNCWNNTINISVDDANVVGFILNNQFANEGCFDNTVNVMVNEGCNVNAVQIGAKCFGNQVNITTNDIEAGAVQVVDYVDAANESSGNTIKINSYNSQTYCLLAYGSDNNYDIVSVLDGRAGAQGTSYAVDIFGNRNTANIKVIDSATWQVRALRVNTGATNNVIPVITRTSTSSTILDSGTTTQIGITV